MRRFLCQMTAGILALSTLGAQQAVAQLQCLSSQERAAFEVQALRSELMVLATGCGDDHSYNAFITRYRPELMANEHDIGAWFKRAFGRRGQQEHDRFVTELANAQASNGSHLGSEFCPRNGQIFSQALALRQSSELNAFAAGQNLFPRSLEVCPVEVAQATPARKVAKTHR